jgi:hypothetical protein
MTGAPPSPQLFFETANANFLVVHGLLTKQANRYALTPDSAMFLDKHSKAYVGGALQFLLLPSVIEGHKQLVS